MVAATNTPSGTRTRADLGDRSRWVGDVIQHVIGEHDVERAVVERHRLRVDHRALTDEVVTDVLRACPSLVDHADERGQ